MRPIWVLALLVSISAGVQAEDWSVGGRDYHNVEVTKVDVEKVHIRYDGGIGTVLIADLPPEIRKRFSYDPAAAKAAQDAEVQREMASDEKCAAVQQKDQVNQQSTTGSIPPVSAPPRPSAAATDSPASNRSQISSLQAQARNLRSQAEMLENAEVQKYNLDTYYDSAGELHHRHTLGHSAEAKRDVEQAIELERQAAELSK